MRLLNQKNPTATSCVMVVFVALSTTAPRYLLAQGALGELSEFSSVSDNGAPQANNGWSQRGQGRIFRDRVAPHWFSDGTKFWYRNDLPQGAREFILVDAASGQRQAAFDHAAVATAMENKVTPTHLPIDAIKFAEDGLSVILIGPSNYWRWRIDSKKLVEISADDAATQAGYEAEKNSDSGSSRTGAESELTFENRTSGTVEIFWISGDGKRQSYGKIEAGQRKGQHTFGGHRWLVTNEKGEVLDEPVASDTPSEVVINAEARGGTARPRGRGRSRLSVDRGPVSPDGKWRAEVHDFNVLVRSVDTEEALTLSQDGSEQQKYGQLTWSPDSQSLLAFRTEPGERKAVHLVRSSPEGGGRAQLESRPYSLPGDKFAKHELNLFRIATREQIKPEVDRFEHEGQQPRVHWSRDGKRFAYEQTDRGHQRFRVINVDVASGKVGTLVDETTKTFIWTAHTESHDLAMVTWLEQSDDLIYVTEKSGWRHMLLLDANTGQEKNAITSGKWVLRGIEKIDETARQVWFRASGCFEQDPYFVHYGRVNFDGTELTWLTSGDGNHTVQYSPDRRFVIDTYSRVDNPPTVELRRTSDGQLVCELERADIEQLKASGWTSPEVFTAKGRDGQTDIWGIICRPRDFDPEKRYPVIEDIYAGPHGSFVPKSFSPSSRYEALTSRGFIVVKIDGMGTANRSKAFQDVCWKNLKDGGFVDRILWMQAAANGRAELDLSRVGIYGTSAGGQNAAAAVLFHPEFYKVAVAACGCHDNRMDKASWNEQWMGYPVGPHYSTSSNIDNAHRLQGKLLLIVGEMDTNVPPESTLRFADALIRADKDFDLLVVPNAGHGNGGAYGQRRLYDYFEAHLLR